MATESSPRRVALVDDNLMFAAGVQAALRRLGFEVRTLPGGNDTVAQVAAAAPEFVLISLSVGGRRGVDLVRQLRSAPGLPGLRILAYHNHTDTATFHAAKEAGADQVLANSAVANHLETVLRAAGLVGGQESTAVE